MTLNALDNKDIRDNLDKVKSWSVEKVSYALKNYQGDPSTTFSDTFGFSPSSSGSASITIAVSGVNLNDLNNGSKQALALSSNDLATMASWFEKDNALKVYMTGTLSQGPVSFDLVVYAKIKIRAKVL